MGVDREQIRRDAEVSRTSLDNSLTNMLIPAATVLALLAELEQAEAENARLRGQLDAADTCLSNQAAEREQVEKDNTRLLNEAEVWRGRAFYALETLRTANDNCERFEAQLAVVPALVEALRDFKLCQTCELNDDQQEHVDSLIAKWEQAQGETP